MENGDLLDFLNSAFSYDLESKYSLERIYLILRNEYSNYTFNDLFVICKIDKLKKLGLITPKIHDSLIQLYNYKIQKEQDLFCVEMSDEEFKHNSDELSKINVFLGQYGLLPFDSIEAYINNSIIPITDVNNYDGLNDNIVMSLIPNNK